MQRTDYKICPYCGAALDVGEKCDCLREELHFLIWEATEAPQKPVNCARVQITPERTKTAYSGLYGLK